MKITVTIQKLSLALVCLLALATEVSAQQLIPRQVLFGKNEGRSQPKISPDGTRVAYIASDPKDVANVWVRTFGKNDDRVVTSDTQTGIHGYSWSADGQGILYNQDRNGDQNGHIYLTDLKTGTTRDLTPYEGVKVGALGEDPVTTDEMLVTMNKRDKHVFDVYRMNLKTGELKLDTQNPGDVISWVTDAHNQVRVAQLLAPDGSHVIRVRDTVTSTWREFLRWGPQDVGRVAGFTPDGKGLYVISSINANTSRMLQIDIATGKQTVLAEDPQYDVSNAVIDPTSHKLEAVEIVRDRFEYQVLDPSVAADYLALKKVRDGDFHILSRDRANNIWSLSFISDNAPPYIYLYDRRTKKATLFSDTNPKIEAYPLAHVKPIKFKSRDGLELHGYLTMPLGKRKNVPMVMLVHGGPWARDFWLFNPTGQLLANRGYGVISVNFRGSTGYGKAFINAGNQEWGGKMNDDLVDTKRWVVQQGYADPHRMCVMGQSYGGYATLAALAFSPDEFVCGIDIVGPANLITLLKSNPAYWATEKAVQDERMGNVDTQVDFLKSRSPFYSADKIKGALLVGQGTNDPRVPKAESDQIVGALRKRNKPVEYYVFTNEGHGFDRPENQKAFQAEVEQFLAKYLGGRAEPLSESETKILDSVRQ